VTKLKKKATKLQLSDEQKSDIVKISKLDGQEAERLKDGLSQALEDVQSWLDTEHVDHRDYRRRIRDSATCLRRAASNFDSRNFTTRWWLSGLVRGRLLQYFPTDLLVPRQPDHKAAAAVIWQGTKPAEGTVVESAPALVLP
jgi:hypothetical protein